MHVVLRVSCKPAGDLLTALLLAKLYSDPDNMQHAVEQALASLQAVLLASAEASGSAAHARDRTAEVLQSCSACAVATPCGLRACGIYVHKRMRMH